MRDRSAPFRAGAGPQARARSTWRATLCRADALAVSPTAAVGVEPVRRGQSRRSGRSISVIAGPATTDVDPQRRARRKRRHSPGYLVREIAYLWMIPA